MRSKGNKASLNRILGPYRVWILLLSLLSVAQSVLQVVMALLIRNVIDAALAHSDGLWLWAVLFAADLVLQVCVHALYSWFTTSAADRFSATLRSRLLKCAVYSVDSRLQEFHSGVLLNRGIEDVNTVCDGVIHALPALAGQVARLIGSFAAVVMIWPSMSILLGAAAVLAAAGIAALRPVLKAKHRKVRAADEKVMSTMQEDLQQLELIQSIQCQGQVQKRFDSLLQKSLKAKRKRRVWSVSSNSILSIVSMLGTGVLLLWGAAKVGAGGLSYGALTSMLQLLSQFRAPVVSLSGLWTRFAAVEVAGERLCLLLDIPEQETGALEIEPKAIVFENVTFRYPGDEVAVVEDFSLRIPLESWSSLSGISGRGKTTLFKLILGLYVPQVGRVYLETDRGEVSCSAQTRHLFAYVPQDYALFSGTVLENLQLVAPDADTGRCSEVLRVAAAEFVWEQAQGLDTHVGENNTGLSKGQLQRIAIARAVLMERRILLLDECTSALDAQTEKQVLQNLRVVCPCAILVTHRPEALEMLPGTIQICMEE